MLWVRRITAGGLVVGAVLGLAGCGGDAGTAAGDKNATGARATGTLRLGSVVVPASLAASKAAWANDAPFHQAVYDTLLRQDPDLKIEPGLATEWSYNADKTVLTLKLRTGVKFSDGTPFDAKVAAENITRFRDGTSNLRSYLQEVRTAEAVDASTLRLTLSAPNPALLSYLAGAAGLQASPKTFGAANADTRPVGTGPYVLDAAKTVIGSTYVYKRNPNYWKPADQHYASIVLTVYQTPTATVNAVRGGQVNGVAVPDASVQQQVAAAGFDVKTSELNFLGLLLFDRDGKITPALKDVRVRQAINYAVDRPTLVKAVGKGLGTPTTQIFKATDKESFDPALDGRYPYDPAKAKQLLKDAGYAGGFAVTIPQVPSGSTVLYDLVKQELGAVGITVKYVNEPQNSLLADVAKGKFSVVAGLPLQTDPTAWHVANFKLLPHATWNPFHTADPTVAALAGKLQTGSAAEAAKAGKDLNRYIVEQAWFAPWYRPRLGFAVDRNTTAVPQQNNAYPYLWNITPRG
ncbi:peptide ABC transporter substrate-binding protein [Actinomadura rayongensis]|uniref:Peptide ABC transporter substrate-binding protein n=1 Tax=Actinomadura rayongensis TaxID=1429076 RepID=A0A6I4WFM1_9ACTN|nr:peptide ABC transporter substrate-binding protein [Actinomadura rayongensis]